jgi:penicillin-binding protein A
MPMFFRVRRMPLVTVGAACAALATVVFAGPSDAPPAANLTSAGPTADAEALPVETRLIGDAPLRGQLDLRRAARDGDQLRIALADGRSVELTIDPEIQKAAEAALAEARAPMGAIVVMGIDGRILALAGRRQDGKDAKDSRRDDRLALTTWAPSASIFKVVTTAALLDAGVDPHDPVCFHGGVRSVVATNLTDDKRRDDRCENLAYAMAKSQNAIIAKLAHRHLDRAKLNSFARAFGYAAKPAFCLDAEVSPVDLPANDELELARAAAGFWHSELSPLGGALLANTVASGGLRVTPRLVKAVTGTDGLRRPVEAVAGERVLDEALARRLGQLMVGTTESGSAYTGFHGKRGGKLLDVPVAGKTGTLNRKDRSLPPLQYSWFVGFAPANAPKVTIAVLLGNGELWHIKAHTAARMVLEHAL